MIAIDKKPTYNLRNQFMLYAVMLYPPCLHSSFSLQKLHHISYDETRGLPYQSLTCSDFRGTRHVEFRNRGWAYISFCLHAFCLWNIFCPDQILRTYWKFFCSETPTFYFKQCQVIHITSRICHQYYSRLEFILLTSHNILRVFLWSDYAVTSGARSQFYNFCSFLISVIIGVYLT